jgi:hypothetical protein
MPDLIRHPSSFQEGRSRLEAGVTGGVMRKLVLLFGVGALAGCGGPNDQGTNQVAKPVAKKKPAYCFFKEADTKDWVASRGKDGNVVVKGKAYRQDSRYKAQLQPAKVTGTSAELSPTVVLNDTGFGAPDNWWDVAETIPDSAAVTSVTVSCGARALAKLEVPPPKS